MERETESLCLAAEAALDLMKLHGLLAAMGEPERCGSMKGNVMLEHLADCLQIAEAALGACVAEISCLTEEVPY